MANILRIFFRLVSANAIPTFRTAVQRGAIRRPAFRNVIQVSAVLEKIPKRCQCTNVATLTEAENRIAEKIKSNLNVSRIEVEDISGGCGSMYRIFVASSEFKGKRTIQQHRIITNILEDEVKDMHGLTIETTAS